MESSYEREKQICFSLRSSSLKFECKHFKPCTGTFIKIAKSSCRWCAGLCGGGDELLVLKFTVLKLLPLKSCLESFSLELMLYDV